MQLCRRKGCRGLLVAALGLLATRSDLSSAEPRTTGSEPAQEIRVISIQGSTLEVLGSGATNWYAIQTGVLLHVNDHIRTGPNTRATLRWSDQSIVPMDALTELEILPPHELKAQFGLSLLKGIISFFHRDRPSRIRAVTRGAAAGIEGTEFALEVKGEGPTERTILSVVDGMGRSGSIMGWQV